MLRLRFFSIWLRLLCVSDWIWVLRLFCSLFRLHTWGLENNVVVLTNVLHPLCGVIFNLFHWASRWAIGAIRAEGAFPSCPHVFLPSSGVSCGALWGLSTASSGASNSSYAASAPPQTGPECLRTQRCWVINQHLKCIWSSRSPLKSVIRCRTVAQKWNNFIFASRQMCCYDLTCHHSSYEVFFLTGR